MNTPNNFTDLINIFLTLIKALLPVVAALALLAFLWGLTKFISRVGGDEKAVDDGKNLMKWGLIALFLLMSFWSIITVVQSDLGFNNFGNLPLLP
ncbi:MAG: hypothetical protein WAX80_00525 [Minisyncoccia bacterium]